MPKLFLNFLLRFLGDFVPVPKAKIWHFSDLVQYRHLKCKIRFLFFKYSQLALSTVTKSIEEKIQEKLILRICTGPNTLFFKFGTICYLVLPLKNSIFFKLILIAKRHLLYGEAKFILQGL